MSSRTLFVIMLIIGVILVFRRSKSCNKAKVISIIFGVVIILIAIFGIFTSLI